jgi:hypothetical protein
MRSRVCIRESARSQSTNGLENKQGGDILTGEGYVAYAVVVV